jgi:hypothetical protein
MKLKTVLVVVPAAVLIFLFASWLSGSTPADPLKEHTTLTEGVVREVIAETATRDINIDLAGDDEGWYRINRGLDLGYHREQLTQLIEGKKVKLYYYYRGFGPFGRSSHICELKQGDSVIFSEIIAD